jgi:hypothetical protein
MMDGRWSLVVSVGNGKKWLETIVGMVLSQKRTKIVFTL